MATTNGAPAVPSQDLNGPVDFMQRYGEERSKRLRDDGTRQYIDLARSDKWKHFLEDPFIEAGTPVNRPVPDGGHTRVLIVGAGYNGLLFAVKLIEAGFKAEELLIVDPAGGFGGTWYWNRYPGLMCDVESYIYMPLLETMQYMPTEKYASGVELRAYAESIAAKYDLHKRAQFQSSVKDMRWDAAKNEWAVTISEKPKGGSETQISIKADFAILASGLMNNAKLPDFKGLDEYKGHMFHPARWDYNYTGGSPEQPEMSNLKDKKVAYIGTGATAIQAIPQLAKWAKELYVFQRTPSSVDWRGNRPTDPEEWKTSIAKKEGWWRERNVNFASFVTNAQPKPEVNMVADAWSSSPSYSALIGGPKTVTMENVAQHVGELYGLDIQRTERVRKRTEEIVKDPATARSLQAWYPTWCKRPCFHDEYLQCFNQPNVHLVDTDGKGVSQLTPSGIALLGKEYDVDLIVMGTGFVSPSIGTAAGKAHIDVEGRDGVSLEARHSAGDLSTLHGVLSRDFPNMFFPGPSQAAAGANHMFTLDQLSAHIVYIIAEGMKKAGGKPIIEPSQEAQEAWAMQVMGGAVSFAALSGCTPGYLNKEGEIDNVVTLEAQMKAARGAIWGRGILDFIAMIESWRGEGKLQGLEVTAAA